MRFFTDFPQALNELKRELKEMGIMVHQKSVQNMDVSNNPDYDAYELQNYTYTVTDPDPASIPLANPEWCYAEIHERTCGKPLNPGNAWKLRSSYWSQFFSKRKPGRFDYAYPERLYLGLRRVVAALRKDPNTRRAFLPVFSLLQDAPDEFEVRIPCTIGYWFYYRQNALHMVYLQRSADFSEHFNNDVWLAESMKRYVASQCKMEPGVYSHWLGSLHIFAKDVKGVF